LFEEAHTAMSAFRCVEGCEAGPAALGVLAPPGRRTFLILRPRALAWDLLLARGDATFREIESHETEAIVQSLARALEEWIGGGPGRVEVTPAATGPGYGVRANVGAFSLIACPRVPGQPYQPVVFSSAEEAHTAAANIGTALCPPAGAQQELYFNTRHFTR